MNSPLSRRELIRTLGRLALTTLPAASLLSCRKNREQETDLTNGNIDVAILPCSEYDPEALLHAIRSGWEATRSPDIKGKRVVIKPNIVDFDPERPVNTDPRFVEALIRHLNTLQAAEVIVAEGSSHNRDAEMIWNKSGYRELCSAYGISLVDLNYDDLRLIENRTRESSLLLDLYLPVTLLDADVVISAAKMKTHRWAGITLSLKNMLGAVPGMKYGWPKNVLHWNGIPESICEINANLAVHYAAIDGVVGMEGYGPLLGSAKKAGVILMGESPLAVDATAARVMGVNPPRVDYFRLARMMNLGTFEDKEIRIGGISARKSRTDFALPDDFRYLRALG